MRFSSGLASLTIFALASLSHAAVIEGLVPRVTTTTAVATTVCACISGEVKVRGVNCGSLETELCTCISLLEQVVAQTTRTPLLTGIRIGGYADVVASLQDKINQCGPKDKSSCTHPENSTPSCSRLNLCGYTCNSGYVDCHGKCKKSCPSNHPRDEKYWGHRTQKSCKAGWTACGVAGGGPRDWECVDTVNDLESCGGCPTGIISTLAAAATGADCTTIENVSDVSCVAGGCAVHKCMPGYKVSASGDSCEEDSSALRTTLHAVAVAAGSFQISK
ncbi:hypothetical protein B0H10DRAFT_291519 [Mycena sp. CBHHK59/15]|nr:hypothetical protein B0H10DRAFT_291519 [Mycena sp. CBHHK59/15]